MAAIHHATRSYADKNGITLAEHDGHVRAVKGKAVVEGDNAKLVVQALLDTATYFGEYKGLGLRVEDDQFVATFADYDVECEAEDALEAVQAALEALQDAQDEQAEEEAEEGQDDGEGSGKVIVDDKYRKEYAARGNPNHCGDWLAVWLGERFSTFDVEQFMKLMGENGVEEGPWSQVRFGAARGWQGRFRMNGRQKLERKIVENGELRADGRKVPVDADWMDAMRQKHPVRKDKAAR